MHGKINIGTVVFTLGVLMLLLRPYFVYQMTTADNRSNPVRAWNLLQRLVKKKDDHHERTTETSALLTEIGGNLVRPFLRRLQRLSRLISGFARLHIAFPLPSTRFLPRVQHSYVLTSCLLI